MFARGNRVRDRLLTKQPVHGLVIRSFAPAIVELAGLAGFDFVWIDLEHGSASFETAEALVRSADCVGIEAMIRIPGKSTPLILRALETGAGLVCVPQVETVAEAEAIARASRYHPEGERGYSTSSRGNRYGFGENWLIEANQRVLVVVQIETPLGVSNAKTIARVPGVDILLAGLADYSQRVGVPGQLDHPDVLNAAQEIASAARAAGKQAAFPAATRAAIRKWLQDEIYCFYCGVDLAVIGKAFSDLRKGCDPDE